MSTFIRSLKINLNSEFGWGPQYASIMHGVLEIFDLINMQKVFAIPLQLDVGNYSSFL